MTQTFLTVRSKVLATLCALTTASTLALSAEDTAPAVSQEGAVTSEAMTTRQQYSYLVGLQVGTYFAEQDIDQAVFLEALADVAAGRAAKIQMDKLNTVGPAYEKKMKIAEQVKNEADAKLNTACAEKSATFLEDIKKKEGVFVTDSGLAYEVLAAGAGRMATQEDAIFVNYTGTHIDGREFDTSKYRGPLTASLKGGLIPGWIEALALMPVGAKWKLYIPADLAYGTDGSKPRIAGNEALVFELEVLGFEKSDPNAGHAGHNHAPGDHKGHNHP